MWGWVLADALGPLVPLEGRFTGAKYVDILNDHMLPSVRQIYPEPQPIYFLQDNSPIHTSRVVQNWFSQHQDVIVINFPAKSLVPGIR